MCGRYTEYNTEDDLAVRYGLMRTPPKLSKNYNVAPGQFMPVVTMGDNGIQLEIMKWGLIPVWAKDPKIGYKLINARADGVFDKPIWKRVILKKRALIPANGFYEWRKPTISKEHKQPFYIRPKGVEIFSFAGIYDSWKDHEGNELRTYSIITTEPNKEMTDIHNRMPVILHKEDEQSWLDPNKDTRDAIEPFLLPFEDNGLDVYKVSEDVNTPRNNDEHLIHALS